MDPNAALSEARSARDAIISAIDTDDNNGIINHAEILAERFTALDDWLAGRGFLPAAWSTPLIPEHGVNALVDDLLWDLFVCALEGGIGYWALSSNYHIWRSVEGSDVADTAGFHTDVTDVEGTEGFDPARIDRTTLVKAFERMAAGPVEFLREDMRQQALSAMHARLGKYNDRFDYDFDADDADCIVQVGLFGKVIFG